ncbi:hypothetical protein QLQ15_05110 [Lysobacter sp. LF1]|uniref:Uncharacterized protein n=1 Tax=Lysobacter stagni TaxID=3045172 RepID=A0ABT6XDR5_9GAMM|nr:hypothetical protein [Lysobacter sp. LF1]MDI9238290.1 hypothetical protein [Lysobacter sp. LF1]
MCLNAQAGEKQSETQVVTYAGVKVGIDAETGRLRPLTSSESAQLDQALTQGQQARVAPAMAKTFNAPRDAAAARATVRRGSHGGVSVKVPESQMTSLVATHDASGQLVVEHTDGSDHADNEAQNEELLK